MSGSTPSGNVAPVRAAGLALGMGMGGFVDGIVFHQILQMHATLSARVPTDTLVGVKVNMVWDGIFHASVWLVVALGIALLWRAGKRPGVDWNGRVLLGAMAMGWGLFNTIEGLFNHYLLHLHHVYERMGLSAWDHAFLASGVALILFGAWAMRAARPENPPGMDASDSSRDAPADDRTPSADDRASRSR